MKTIKLLGVWLCVAMLTLPSYAQRNDLILTNSKSIDNNPYEGVEGSPFYFDNWQKGKIYPESNSDPIEEVLLNFNGYTKSFEIKKGSRCIALDEQWYQKVEIEQKGNLLSYQKGLLPKYNNQFTRAVFLGTTFQIVQEFHVSLTTREKQIYGKVNEVQSFYPHRNYYFVKNGQGNLLKLKKKSILAFFPTYKSRLERYAKKSKLKWNSEQDLVRLFTYYEEIKSATAHSVPGQE